MKSLMEIDKSTKKKALTREESPATGKLRISKPEMQDKEAEVRANKIHKCMLKMTKSCPSTITTTR